MRAPPVSNQADVEGEDGHYKQLLFFTHQVRACSWLAGPAWSVRNCYKIHVGFWQKLIYFTLFISSISSNKWRTLCTRFLHFCEPAKFPNRRGIWDFFYENGAMFFCLKAAIFQLDGWELSYLFLQLRKPFCESKTIQSEWQSTVLRNLFMIKWLDSRENFKFSPERFFRYWNSKVANFGGIYLIYLYQFSQCDIMIR